MKPIEDDHSQSSIPVETAGKLPGKSSTRQNKGTFSKTDARYWQVAGRLFKDDSADYSCRFSVRGRRAQFCLQTSNQRGAAKKAAELYSLVSTDGWEAGFALYRPEEKSANNAATVGSLIEESFRISTARRHTLDAYAKAFRCIVSEIEGIKPSENREGEVSPLDAWREKVNAVPLAKITPAEVTAWKNARLRAAEKDPLAARRAAVTVNSLIRNAKALYGKKVLPFIEQTIALPKPLPFDGVSMEKAPSMRYVSKVDAFAILASAREELSATKPEAFKVMVLALVCGLRRSEIDHLLWRSFDFPRKVLRVESTEFSRLKSEDSAGEIDLDDDTVALFRGFRAQHPTAKFVIESPNVPRNELKARCYRCGATFKEVLTWLRAQGVDDAKPLHTMRKEIGSIIASEHGIFEASRYLRHSDIRITSAVYADKKKTITPKTFKGLLGESEDKEAADFEKEKPKKRRRHG